jgi:hypothetical protein
MRYEKHTFENTTVRLDGNEFIECSFVRCKLLFGGQSVPVTRGCTMTECEMQFVGASQLTIHLLSLMLQLPEFRGSILSQLELPMGKTKAARASRRRPGLLGAALA